MFRVMSGYLLGAAFTSLYQDFLGREKYIQMVEAHWVDSSFSVPVALLMIVVAVILQWQTVESVRP